MPQTAPRNRKGAKGAEDAKSIRESARPEPDPELNRLSHEVIGSAIEVHRVLGPGLLESVYEEALCVELGLRGLPFVRQPAVDFSYKERLTETHKAQVISYLRMTGYQLALLINFNVARLKDGIQRIICT